MPKRIREYAETTQWWPERTQRAATDRKNEGKRVTAAFGAETLECVLGIAARGWRLLPCAERAKKPLISDWPRRASTDVGTIRRWVHDHPSCNWGIATGPASGIFVIDIDGESGKTSLCSLVEAHASWARTLRVATANGSHFYFAYPTGVAIRNSTGKLGVGVDVRGEGGYVLCPPSTHPSGPRYEWASPPEELASPPEWLLGRVVNATAERSTVLVPSEIGMLPEGRRNDGLTRMGGYLRRKGLSLAEIETVLMAQNARRCRPPLRSEEVARIAASVSRYAPGGLDPLEAAWLAIPKKTNSQYELFVELARQLQQARPQQPVAMPLERIAALMGLHWTTVRYYRNRAVMDGILLLTADPVPHRRAAEYRVTIPTIPIIGLVGKNSMVGNSPKPHGGNGGATSMVGNASPHGGSSGVYRGFFHDR